MRTSAQEPIRRVRTALKRAVYVSQERIGFVSGMGCSIGVRYGVFLVSGVGQLVSDTRCLVGASCGTVGTSCGMFSWYQIWGVRLVSGVGQLVSSVDCSVGIRFVLLG